MLGNAEKSTQKPAQSDSTLMLAYRTGDVGAFELLYKRYKDGLFAYFVRNTNNEVRARELFQDVWMSIIQGRDNYQESERFSAWLYRIAHNRLVDHYRYMHSRRQPVAAGYEAVSAIASPLRPQEVITYSQDRKRLNRALGKLPPLRRDELIMRLEWRLGLAEIAGIIGEPKEIVKSRLRYATNKLRMYLRDADEQ